METLLLLLTITSSLLITHSRLGYRFLNRTLLLKAQFQIQEFQNCSKYLEVTLYVKGPITCIRRAIIIKVLLYSELFTFNLIQAVYV